MERFQMGLRLDVRIHQKACFTNIYRKGMGLLIPWMLSGILIQVHKDKYFFQRVVSL